MTQVLYGFHAVGVRLKIAPASVLEVHVDAQRRDARMRRFVQRLEEAGARVVTSDDAALARLARNPRHQGVVAKVLALKAAHSMDDVLDGVQAAGRGPALVLALDGVTDPHNLGACLRSCDGAGAHLVIAPRDRAVGLSATVAKVASGAAESVPYLMVTNLARTLGELKERGLKVVGACDDAPLSLHEVDLRGPVALVLGAEGSGMRALTRSSCDELVRIPMRGAVESLNVSVAAAVCLYEALRQRSEGAARAQAPISPG